MPAPVVITDGDGVEAGTAGNPLVVDATVSIAANSTVDLNRVAGTATAVNNGTASAGAQRVVIASDNTPFAVKIDQTTPGTTNLVALAANQSVNVAQINGVATTMGNGASGTGVQRVTIASDSTGTINVRNVSAAAYETVAAGQTAQVLGGSGATGDTLIGLLVVPATTSPGNVIILDNATSITVFTGGASSVSNLVPFWIAIGAQSVSGAWKVTTGSNVSVVAVGNFSA